MSAQADLPLLSTDLFKGIQNVQDFVGLLNDVFKVLYNKETGPFKASSLNYFAYQCKDRYVSFSIQKKNGGTRPINAPMPFLKLIQRCTNFALQSQFKPHHTSHGFLFDRNIVSNASRHLNRKYVLNIDIENFFGSIAFRRVKTVLGLEPFNLKNERENLAFLIANLCCNNGVLPQGGPCSPILTNIVCQRLDRKLFQFSKLNKVMYTRYADDISFSTDYPAFTESFKVEAIKIIDDEGFSINESKTRLQNSTQSQKVTGIVVNKKPNVDREFIRKIRAILNNYRKYGYDHTQKIFEYNWCKLNTKPPQFVNSVHGQIEYLGMVRGKDDHIFQKYRKQFIDLFDNPIDFSFITNEKVRQQLVRDFSKMKRIKDDLEISEEERFTEYCINAFLQIEELINYYFMSVMTFERLCDELDQFTFLDKRRAKGKTHAGEIDMVFKVFLFEKYFFYRKGIYYDSVINKIRLVRNEGLHRCSAIIKDEKKIFAQYQELQDRIKAHEAINQTEYRLSNREKHLEYEVKLIPFLKERNYKIVKHAISEVAIKVKDGLDRQINI